MSHRAKVVLRVQGTSPIEVVGPEQAYGWGDTGGEVELHGEVGRITVSRDGKSQFGIDIQSDGTVIITDFAGMCFQSSMPQNFRLHPTRPWK